MPIAAAHMPHCMHDIQCHHHGERRASSVAHVSSALLWIAANHRHVAMLYCSNAVSLIASQSQSQEGLANAQVGTLLRVGMKPYIKAHLHVLQRLDPFVLHAVDA